MEKKIPFQNRLFALIISIIFSITLLVSFFALPIELVLLNNQSYGPVLENEENQSRYPDIISEVLTSELYKAASSNQLPKILSDRDGLKTVLKKNISPEMSLSIFKELTNQVLDYLNFRIPNSSIELEIGQLKSAFIMKSEAIASDYVSILPRCTESLNVTFSSNNTTPDIFQLPPCKPSENILQSFINPMAFYIEDAINRLPASVSISGILSYDIGKTDNYFYYYSLGRWALRLLPIAAIGLLIMIALLLHSEKRSMLKWVGKLLAITSGLGLIGLVILLIGFDQFVALLINRYLGNFVKGFGVLLLGLIQTVGYTTLIWVLISIIAVFTFGILLSVISKLFKPKSTSDNGMPVKVDELTKEATLPENLQKEIKNEKAIKPETLEEIEKQKKKNSKI